jgi:hypothetical protein
LLIPSELCTRLERVGRDEGRTAEEQALHLLRRCVGQDQLEADLPPAV